MFDVLFAAMWAGAATWKTEVAERRRISAHDPVADTLDYCAGEMTSQLKALESDTVWLTVEQYADLKLVTPQTVRNWIRRGELAAHDTEKGYRIKRGEERQSKRRGMRIA